MSDGVKSLVNKAFNGTDTLLVEDCDLKGKKLLVYFCHPHKEYNKYVKYIYYGGSGRSYCYFFNNRKWSEEMFTYGIKDLLQKGYHPIDADEVTLIEIFDTDIDESVNESK